MKYLIPLFIMIVGALIMGGILGDFRAPTILIIGYISMTLVLWFNEKMGVFSNE